MRSAERAQQCRISSWRRLAYDDLGQLIADSLHCEPKRADPLVQLVHEKTGGNPFFAIQFLHALADEALLVFDHADSAMVLGPRCASTRNAYTDNVVDLMVGKLNRLPPKPKAALRQLACVGSGAEFASGTVCQTSQEDFTTACGKPFEPDSSSVRRTPTRSSTTAFRRLPIR